MLYKLQIFFIINLVMLRVDAFYDKPVLIKMDPDMIIDALKSVMSSDYGQKLAKEFAKDAAIQESNVKDNRQQVWQERSILTSPTTRTPQKIIPKAKEYPDLNLDATELLTERDAFTLIKEPSPDGDDLELENKEFNENHFVKFIPVMEVQRINGMYYRRFLGLIERV